MCLQKLHTTAYTLKLHFGGPKRKQRILTMWGINYPETTTCCDVNKLHVFKKKKNYLSTVVKTTRNSGIPVGNFQTATQFHSLCKPQKITHARKKVCIVFLRVNTKILICDWLKKLWCTCWSMLEKHRLSSHWSLKAPKRFYWCNILTCSFFVKHS